ncbi:MAG: tyrosine-protein phosphatase [Cyclobacteriaceae bacterium]
MATMFKNNPKKYFARLHADLHSHLLPGLDDGVNTVEESIQVIKKLVTLGYKKIITSPHYRSDMFPNTREGILQKYALIKDKIASEGIEVTFETAAEYFIDDHFEELIKHPEQLLTFGDNFVLIEASFINEPVQLKEVIFYLNAQGLKPILVHPERYQFFAMDKDRLHEINRMDVLWQINLMSITGYYGKPVQKMAEWMIEQKMVHFLGSDCHHIKHADELETLPQYNAFKKALKLNLLNNTL